ncbi:MAG: TetR/AcrR family transcriptional regulator [Paramuribaculum sp.]|nr:TetR/AcrR family transcriptional regulator [Paramuribaculum sp.]
MVSKTRDKLLEVARNLFMVKGVEHTTMNDIATASERGRRTIYTYFKSKREIYQAVVERESELVISRLREVVQSSVPPEEKLRSYLTIRFGILTQTQTKSRQRPDRYITGLFTRDTRRGDRIYQLALSKEADMFESLLRSGIDCGAFRADQAMRLPTLLNHTIISASASSPTQLTIEDQERIHRQLIDFIVDGILTDTNPKIQQ